MSTLSKYVERLARHDSTLIYINLVNEQLTDLEFVKLIDCLLAHPDVVSDLWLSMNQLTDETGVKLAQYVAASSTIECLGLFDNKFGEATYLAMATALRVNSSLRWVDLYDNQAVDQIHADTAFVEALRLNSVRSAKSWWCFYTISLHVMDFTRLKDAAEKYTPPSMLEFVLCVHLDMEKIKTKIH